MPLGRSVRNILINDAAVAAIVVARVYPVRGPENGDLPCIVYHSVGDDPTYSADGETGLNADRMQLDSYATTFDVAWDLADKVRLALSGYVGTVSGVVIRGILWEGTQDLSEPTSDRGEKPIYRMVSDYEMQHDQTP